MLRLDYTITYYQLNCLLAEEFADAEYFGRMAKLETIVDNRPIGLGIAQIGDLGRKINALEICK